MNPDRVVEPNEETPQATRLDDVRIHEVRPLISSALLQYELPADAAVQAFVERSRAEVANVLHGRDDRLLVVVGPCSVHDADQALDYADRLKRVAASLEDALLLVMRVYFEKPRTTVGWKGYINDPRLDGSFRKARELLLAVAQRGVPSATEYLDLLSPQYIADLISWGAIGARTTESPSHRQLASGMSCTVGFKNGTNGDVQVAADALIACRSPHAFMGITKMGQAAIFDTLGNQDSHIILRGGSRGPNHGAAEVEAACEVLRKAGLPQRVMVDCSHANSNKQYRLQVDVANGLAGRIAGGDRRLMGIMIESHLQEGRQDLKPGVPLRPGVSITDGCIGWDQTVPVLETLAQAVRTRRTLSGG